MTSDPAAATGWARWPLQYFTAAGPHAGPVVSLNWFLLGLSVVVILIFTVAVGWSVFARRQPMTAEALSVASASEGGRGMPWLYVGLPLTMVALVVALFWTMLVMARIDTPAAARALTITVTGRQWWWQVDYPARPGGRAFRTANEIHIPVGVPVLVRLRGADVIHSFWVPALAGKTDTIPGRENVTWLQADRAGVYRGQCTEYCGAQHAHMGFMVYADPPAAFAAWRAGQERPAATFPVVADSAQLAARFAAARSPITAALGEPIFVAHCGGCHAMAGTAAQGQRGPDLSHLMSRRTLAALTLSNTTNNLGGWISDPQAQKPGALMPATRLNGPQLQAVIAYLEAQR
jgi:cytochrome c oxidase subunit 2